MDCCGNRRKQIKNKKNNPPQPPVFAYIGRTSVIAIGGATGRRYYFPYPGARMVVDPRDRPSLAAVPVLRQIKDGAQ